MFEKQYTSLLCNPVIHKQTASQIASTRQDTMTLEIKNNRVITFIFSKIVYFRNMHCMTVCHLNIWMFLFLLIVGIWLAVRKSGFNINFIGFNRLCSEFSLLVNLLQLCCCVRSLNWPQPSVIANTVTLANFIRIDNTMCCWRNCFVQIYHSKIAQMLFPYMN